MFSQCLWCVGHTSLSAAGRIVKPYNLLTTLSGPIGKIKRQLKDTMQLHITKLKIIIMNLLYCNQ